jgi:hypothetical protein
LLLIEEKSHGGDAAKKKGVGDNSDIDEKNVIEVTFGDLAEEDQLKIKAEMNRELEDIESTKWREKLACYQKTRNGVIQRM